MIEHDNIQYLIHRIGLGKLYFHYKDNELVLVSPSTDIKYKSEIYYNSLIENNKYEDWIRKDNVVSLLVFLGLWDNNSEKLIKQLEKTIENMKVQLYQSRAQTNRVKSIKKDLQNYKDSLYKLQEKKHSLDYLTLEDYAAIQKTEYIIYKTLYLNRTKKRYFNKCKFNNINHSDLTNILRIISTHTIDLDTYKKIALNESWKTIWNINKTNVFKGKSAYELTDEQRTLVNISMMYDRIYEHPECPEEKVIEDSDMLDGWMIEQKRKAEQQKKENQANSVSNKHGNAREVFIVADREEAEDVMGLNSWESQNIIKQRQSIVEKEGDVGVMNLPDIKMEYVQQMNNRNRK